MEKPSTTVGIETWGGGSSRTRGKPSKLDLIRAISIETGAKTLDIGTLSLVELNKILRVAKTHTKVSTNMPISSFKEAYLIHLRSLFPTVTSLNKLSVASLQDLLGAFLNEK
jgi:hypothetical protein